MRTLVAFVLAPVLSSAVAAGLSTMDLHPLTLFILFCAAFYVLQILIGIPAHLLLRRRGRQNIWIYAVLGAGASALPLLLFGLLHRGQGGMALGQTLHVTALFAVLGAAVGSVFWVVARPDKVARRTGQRSR
jgi:hypothetical protein